MPLTDEDILAAKFLGEIQNGVFQPNLACGLIFAIQPQEIVPGCRIRFLRFDGTEQKTGAESNLVKDQLIDGNLPTIISEAAKLMHATTRDFTKLGNDGKFYTAPEYPPDAWYEAIVNACVHRSYVYKNMTIMIRMFDDRLEIQSPGAFPPPVTPENIYEVTCPRNPYLMEAMFQLQYVKMINEGTKRMKHLMQEMELPPPLFIQQQIGSASVKVTLQNNIAARKEFLDADAARILGESIADRLSQDERRVVNFVAEYGRINVSECLRLTQKTWPASRRLLAKLVTIGILDHIHKPGKDRDPAAHFVLKSSKP